MKKLLKGFTLVEILIVIVIIGILIGALVPRMQSAQGRARDVARKNDLSQLQAAILVSYQDKGNWPKVDSGYADALNISDISSEILAAGMNGVPTDPLNGSDFEGLGSDKGAGGQYRYMVIDSYGSAKGGFVLMAKTEVEGGSNWVVCSTGETSTEQCSSITDLTNCPDSCTSPDTTNGNCGAGTYTVGNASEQGILKVDNDKHPDVQSIKPCASLSKTATDGKCTNDGQGHACTYSNESQLRYILIN